MRRATVLRAHSCLASLLINPNQPEKCRQVLPSRQSLAGAGRKGRRVAQASAFCPWEAYRTKNGAGAWQGVVFPCRRLVVDRRPPAVGLDNFRFLCPKEYVLTYVHVFTRMQSGRYAPSCPHAAATQFAACAAGMSVFGKLLTLNFPRPPPAARSRCARRPRFFR
jgi:hypothetical protein